MEKEANVHRLPTEDRTSKIWLDNDTGKLLYDPVGVMNCTPQNLYITTDEEIKEGDWYLATIFGYGTEETKPLQWSVGTKPCGEQPMGDKIIATTDPKLNYECKKCASEEITRAYTCKCKSLTNIPQSFIEEYYKAGGIDKVLVEFNYGGRCEDPMVCLRGCHVSDGTCKHHINKHLKLKTDSNNCIIIHPVEEKMYSRKELENMMMQSYIYGQSDKTDSFHKRENTINKLIKENL